MNSKEGALFVDNVEKCGGVECCKNCKHRSGTDEMVDIGDAPSSNKDDA